MSAYEWTFGDPASALYFSIAINTTTNQIVVESFKGSLDLNALWFSDGDLLASENGGSTTLTKSDNALNMNGSTAAGVVWDDVAILSSAGLGKDGVNKLTYISAGETVVIDGSAILTGYTPEDWAKLILGARATSVNGSDSLKLVDSTAATLGAQCDAATVLEDSSVAGNVLTNDVGRAGNTLKIVSFTIAGDPKTYAAGETAAVIGVGNLTMNLDGSYNFAPVPNYAGPVPLVSYRATDADSVLSPSLGVTMLSTLKIDITPVEDEATGTLAVTGTAEEGGALTAALTAADEDGLVSTAYGWERLVGSDWVPAGSGVTLPIAADQSMVGWTVRAVATTTDAFGGTTTFTGTSHTILNVNDVPAAESQTFYVSEDGPAISGGFFASDPDGDDLTYSVVGAVPAGFAFKSTGAGFTYDPAGSFDYLANGATTTVSVDLRAYDGHAFSDPFAVTFVVSGVNDAPTMNTLASRTVSEDGPGISGSLSAIDPDGPTLTYQLISGPQNGFTFNPGTGDWTFNPAGFYEALNTGQTADASFVVRAFDGSAFSQPITVALTVQGVTDVSVVNGSFLNGFTGWSTTGGATVVNGQAVMQTGGGSQAVGSEAMEAWFDGLTGTATVDIPFSATNASGQAIAQKVALANPNATSAVVTFQWAFDAPSGANPADDFAFFMTASSASGGATRITEIWSAAQSTPTVASGYTIVNFLDLNGSAAGTGMTGGDSLTMRTSSFQVDGITGGELWLSFGIMDWQNGGTSTLFVDNIVIA